MGRGGGSLSQVQTHTCQNITSLGMSVFCVCPDVFLQIFISVSHAKLDVHSFPARGISRAPGYSRRRGYPVPCPGRGGYPVPFTDTHMSKHNLPWYVCILCLSLHFFSNFYFCVTCKSRCAQFSCHPAHIFYASQHPTSPSK